MRVPLAVILALSLPFVGALRVSLLAIGINLAMNLLLVKVLGMGHVGLATTTGCLALVNFVQLAFHLRRIVPFGRVRQWLEFAAAVLAASLLCALAAWLADAAVAARLGAAFTPRCAALLAGVVAGGGAYVAATMLLRVPEAMAALGLARRLVRRFTSGRRAPPGSPPANRLTKS